MPNIMTKERIEHLREVCRPLRSHKKSRHVFLELIESCPKCGERGRLTAHLIRGNPTWCFNGFSILHRKWLNGKFKRHHCWLGKSLTGRVSPRIIGPMAFCSKCKTWKSLNILKLINLSIQ